MPIPGRRIPRLLPARLLPILGMALLVRLFFLAVTPFDHRHQNLGIIGFNDELSHINYVRYLAEQGSLPVQKRSVTDKDAFVHNDFEYYQPPAYYLACAPVYRLLEGLAPGMGVYGIRLISVVFGVLTVAAAHRVGACFGARTGLLAAGLLALFPAHVYFTSIATNDSLAWLAGTLLLSAVLRMPGAGWRFSDQAKLALLLTAGLYSKSTLLTLVPLVLVKPLLAGRAGRGIRLLLPPLAVIALAFALASPYYARNIALYGSALGMEAGHGAQAGLFQDHSWPMLYSFLSWSVVTFWNPIHLPLGFHNPGFQAALVSATLLSAAVILLGWRRILRLPSRPVENHGVLWAAIALSTAGYVYYNLRFPQSDARLMFQSLTGLMAIFALGMEHLMPRTSSVPRGIPESEGVAK